MPGWFKACALNVCTGGRRFQGSLLCVSSLQYSIWEMHLCLPPYSSYISVCNRHGCVLFLSQVWSGQCLFFVQVLIWLYIFVVQIAFECTLFFCLLQTNNCGWASSTRCSWQHHRVIRYSDFKNLSDIEEIFLFFNINVCEKCDVVFFLNLRSVEKNVISFCYRMESESLAADDTDGFMNEFSQVFGAEKGIKSVLFNNNKQCLNEKVYFLL